VVDELPEGRGAGSAWLVDGRHNCSKEQLCRWRGKTFQGSDLVMVRED
jgi:hypothetical protein